MKITPCDCRAAHYQRVKRSSWIKAVALGRRLYHCHGCGQLLLLAPDEVAKRLYREGKLEARRGKTAATAA